MDKKKKQTNLLIVQKQDSQKEGGHIFMKKSNRNMKLDSSQVGELIQNQCEFEFIAKISSQCVSTCQQC